MLSLVPHLVVFSYIQRCFPPILSLNPNSRSRAKKTQGNQRQELIVFAVREERYPSSHRKGLASQLEKDKEMDLGRVFAWVVDGAVIRQTIVAFFFTTPSVLQR